MAHILKCGFTTARKITINDTEKDEKGHKKTYNLIPGGGEVHVPDRLVKSKFVQALIASGDIVNLGQAEADAPTAGEELEALRQQCDLLGIEYDGRWKAGRLQAEIDKATAA